MTATSKSLKGAKLVLQSLHNLNFCLNRKPSENIVGEKEKMLVKSIFSSSHNVFYHSKNQIPSFELYSNCHLQNSFNLDKSMFCLIVR